VQIVDLIMIALVCAALISSLLVVLKLRELKRHFLEEHRSQVNQLLAAIGEVESMSEASRRATVIVEIMRRYNVTGLVLPLKTGGMVNFQLLDAGFSAKNT
jgi:hypothetical protein